MVWDMLTSNWRISYQNVTSYMPPPQANSMREYQGLGHCAAWPCLTHGSTNAIFAEVSLPLWIQGSLEEPLFSPLLLPKSKPASGLQSGDFYIRMHIDFSSQWWCAFKEMFWIFGINKTLAKCSYISKPYGKMTFECFKVSSQKPWFLDLKCSYYQKNWFDFSVCFLITNVLSPIWFVCFSPVESLLSVICSFAHVFILCSSRGWTRDFVLPK